jgi:hypothetical protein
MCRLMLRLVVSIGVAGPLAEGRQPAPAGATAVQTLRGVVLADDRSPSPLRRARVVAEWAGGRTEPGFTDDQGRFTVSVASAAVYTLTISKPGYAAQQLRRTREVSADPIAVRLARGAVITGTVFDRTGEPASLVGVRVQRTDASGKAYAAGHYVTDTDDRGEFRIGSLPAGRYAVILNDSLAGALTDSPTAKNGAVDSGTVVDIRAGEEVTLARVHEPRLFPVPGTRAREGIADGDDRVVIQGRVRGANGRPLAGATVRVTHVGIGSERTAATDADGRYQLGGMPAGTLRVAVEHGAGAGALARAKQSARSVTVRKGERVNGVDITFPRGAAVSGLIVDEYGEPLEGLAVRVSRVRFSGGRTSLEAAADVPGRRTDDRGQYRLHGLPAGTYYLVASEELSQEDPFRARTVVRRVFYPGVDEAGRAVPLQTDGRQDVFGVNMAFPFARLSRVYGRALDSAGRPFRGSLTLSATARSGAPALETRSMDRVDGTFEFPGVPDGEYVLKATTETPPGFFAREPGRDDREFGLTFVTVAGGDASVLVRTTTGSSLTGRIVVEGDASPDSVPDVGVETVPSDVDLTPPAWPRTASVGSDARFELANLTGPVRIAVTGLPPEWWLKSVDIDGVNAADDPVTFGSKGQSRGGVEIVLSRAAAEISGRVSGGAGASPGAVVLIFPIDSRRWYSRSRFLRLTTADADGNFSTTGLPPEEYVVAALEPSAVDPLSDEWQNPDLLSALASAGRRIALKESARTTADLRVTALPR